MLSGPNAPKSTALFLSAFATWVGVRVGLASRRSAATPAAWGAAAEVPGKVPGEKLGKSPAPVIEIISGATKSGFNLLLGEGKKIERGPWELKGSIVSGSLAGTAPTAITLSAAG